MAKINSAQVEFEKKYGEACDAFERYGKENGKFICDLSELSQDLEKKSNNLLEVLDLFSQQNEVFGGTLTSLESAVSSFDKINDRLDIIIQDIELKEFEDNMMKELEKVKKNLLFHPLLIVNLIMTFILFILIIVMFFR